jgi:hypothetical protein
MSSARGLVGALLAVTLSVSTTGCLKKVLIDGQISGTRDGADAVSTLHDFEVARSTIRASLGTLEGLYKLAPYNEDNLYLLTKAWTGVTSGFTEDDYELAQEGKDDQNTAYQLQRTISGYERAQFFGIQLLNKKATGFDAAERNAETMRQWLLENFNDRKEAEDLLWISAAFIGLVGAARDNPAVVANLYIGVAIAERSVELNDKLEYGLGHMLLGAYHARTAQSELDEAKQHFDAAVKIGGGKYLLTELNYASRYFCAKSDRKSYEKMLNDVLAAGDPIPEARLQNLIAKRKAQRYLESKVFQEECGFVD